MQRYESYWMMAKWGSREESPTAIAARFLRTIDALRTLNPLLDVWSWGDYHEIGETEGQGGVYPLDDIRPRMAAAVARNVGDAGDAAPDPDNGYKLMAQADRTAPGSLISLSGSAGARPEGRPGFSVTPFTNRMNFKLGPEPDPSFLRYAFWREVMLLLAETWEATWVEAWPDDMMDHWGPKHAFRAVWMCYVSPHFAPLVTPPPGIIAERRPNGGLFMAATDAMFRTVEPRHLAGARAIEAALQPLNRLDYPIDEPYL